MYVTLSEKKDLKPYQYNVESVYILWQQSTSIFRCHTAHCAIVFAIKGRAMGDGKEERGETFPSVFVLPISPRGPPACDSRV